MKYHSDAPNALSIPYPSPLYKGEDGDRIKSENTAHSRHQIFDKKIKEKEPKRKIIAMTTEGLKRAVAVKREMDIMSAKVKDHERALRQLGSANDDGRTNITYKFVDPSGFYNQDMITIGAEKLMKVIGEELEGMKEELARLTEEFEKM